ETGSDKRCEGAGRFEEEVGIAEKREGWVTGRIGSRAHVEKLLADLIHQCPLQVGAESGAQEAFVRAGVRIESAQAGERSLKLAHRAVGGGRSPEYVAGGGISGVIGERGRIAAGESTDVEVVVDFTDAVDAVAARHVNPVAVGGARR